MPFDNLKKMFGAPDDTEPSDDSSDEGMQKLRDMLAINKDRINMGLNPSLQGPTSDDTTLPAEASYNQDVTKDVAAGSLKSGDSAKTAIANAELNSAANAAKTYSKEHYDKLMDLWKQIAERPTISRDAKQQVANKLDTYRKMARIRGVDLD